MLAGVAGKGAGAWKVWEALEHLGDTSAHRWVNGLHCSRRLNDFFFFVFIVYDFIADLEK